MYEAFMAGESETGVCLWQGLYRVAEMIEQGFVVSNYTLSRLQVPASAAVNNMTLILHLYSRYR